MVRFKKLGYVAFTVTDLMKSANFYHEMVGLDLVETRDDCAFVSCSHDHHCIALYKGETPGLKRVAFELETRDDFARLQERLTESQCAFTVLSSEERAVLRLGQALRVRDPSGIEIEFYWGMTQRPGPVGAYPSEILRLGHIVFLVPNLEKVLGFYVDLLNFKVSDFRVRSESGKVYAAFLRCYPSPYHHSIVFLETRSLQYQHTAFMVKSLDGLMRGRNRMIKKQIPVGKTPGRHMASGSIFQYFSDPDGITLEYTLGMEEFPVENAREPRLIDDSWQASDVWDGEGGYDLAHLGHVEIG